MKPRTLSWQVLVLLGICVFLSGCMGEREFEDWYYAFGQIGVVENNRGEIAIEAWREFYSASEKLTPASEANDLSSEYEVDDQVLAIDGKTIVLLRWTPLQDETGKTGAVNILALEKDKTTADQLAETIAKKLSTNYVQ